MPRKIKLENKVKKQKQKQTQKQSVKQSVVIKLDGIQGKKRHYKKRRQREPSEKKEQYQMTAPPLPPNVIYQSTQYLPYTTESPTVSEKIPLKIQTLQATPSSMFQDVGVGREGLVEILEPPEPEYIPLVSKKASIVMNTEPLQISGNTPISNSQMPPNFQLEEDKFQRLIKNRTEYFQSLKEPIQEASLSRISPVNQMSNQLTNEMQQMELTDIKKRRTKKEMEEAKQMAREDIASINLGLTQFNPTNQLSLMKPTGSTNIIGSESGSESESESGFNVITPLTTTTALSSLTPLTARRNTWSDLLQRYQVLTGTAFQRRKGYTKQEFIKLIEKMEKL